jgi:hypothetical protein
MRFLALRIAAAFLLILAASAAQAQNPMLAYVRYQDASARGQEAHTKLDVVQDTSIDKLSHYYDDLTGYNNPAWTQTQRLSYQNADTQCAEIIYVLTERGFFFSDALDDADGWFQSGVDYMSFGQWADAVTAFDNCIGNGVPVDYGYTQYMDDYDDLYVALCGWIAYMDAMLP